MSSEPKAVGYVNGDGLNELKAGKAAGITVGIYSETLPRTTPLYDEQALSVMRAELNEVRGMCAEEAENNARLRCEKFELEEEVDALRRDAERWQKFCAAFDDPCRRQALARMFGLYTDAFEMPFNRILDAAMEKSA